VTNSGSTQPVLRFGVFEADLHAGELKKNGAKIKLSDQAFRLLAVLLANPDQVVTREELRRQVWPEGTFVDFDHGLSLAITKIRTALGDDADNPRFIATVPRRGYKFLAPVSVIPRTSRLFAEPASTPKSTETRISVPEGPVYPRWRRALLVLMTAFSVFSSIVWIYYAHTRRISKPFDSFRMMQLTHSGKHVLTAIAPDGRYLLSAYDENGLESLWLHNVPSGSDTQVAPPAPVYYQSLTFSPDGNYIYFRRAEGYLGMLFSLYRQPVLGGKPQFITFDVDSDTAFSPDGQNIAFFRANDPEMGKYRLIIASVSGKDERIVRVWPIAAFFPQSLAWSPDGKLLAYSVLQPEGALSNITLVDLPGGQTRTLARFVDKRFAELRWLPDGTGLVALYHPRGPYFANGQIGIVGYPNGGFRPVTRDTNKYESLTLSADGLTLATVQAKTKTSISFVDTGNTNIIANFETGVATWFDFTPNGDLLISNLDTLVRAVPGGRSSRTIVADPAAFIDTLANCGGLYVVFTWNFHNGENNTNIWRVNYDGSNPVRLSTGKSDADPVCSPDGKWVYYRQADTQEIFRVSVDGRNAEPIPRGVGPLVIVGSPTISPDGKTLGYSALVGDPAHDINEQKVVLIDSRPGTHRPPILLAPDARIAGPVSFMPDGKSVIYPIRVNGVDNVWVKPLDGSPGRRLTDFSRDQIAVVRPSRNGRFVGMLRYAIEADVVLIQQSITRDQQN
jgi:DNA-binding winged helix-turn-helix (wHTH) protein/Tol biopolymer transport system component